MYRLNVFVSVESPASTEMSKAADASASIHVRRVRRAMTHAPMRASPPPKKLFVDDAGGDTEQLSEGPAQQPTDGARMETLTSRRQYDPNADVRPSAKARTSKEPTLSPGIPGDPGGMPGRPMPSTAGRSARRSSIASTGTWPSTT